MSWERMEYLRDRIQDQQTLKEAQVRDGADYQFFQNEVTQLTNELRKWEENIDALDELADRITTVNSQIGAAQQDAARAAGTWWRLATACGSVGALLFALGLRWSLNSLLLEVGSTVGASGGRRVNGDEGTHVGAGRGGPSASPAGAAAGGAARTHSAELSTGQSLPSFLPGSHRQITGSPSRCATSSTD